MIPQAWSHPSGSPAARPGAAGAFNAAMLVVLLVGVLVAFVTTADYGESWDEAANYGYGRASLQAYFGSQEFLSYGDQVYHGPFYVMLWDVGSRAFKNLHPGWLEVDAGHFTNYLVFTLGVGAFYLICLKLVSPGIAFGAALIFMLQPMLYGYAFINQKDTPFMALLAMAVAAGLMAVDRFDLQRPGVGLFTRQRWSRVRGAAFRQDVRRLGPLIKERPWLVLGLGVAFIILLSVVVGVPYRGWIQPLVQSAYDGTSWPIVNRLFDRLAQDRVTIPLESYMAKARALFTMTQIAFGFVLGAGVLVGLKRAFPHSLDGLDRDWLGSVGILLAAGALMGLATSIRVAGPLAGGLVAIYFWLRRRWEALGPLMAYGILAVVAMYVTWPYLWGAPIAHLAKSFNVMSNFTPHTVLYKGYFLQSDALPWTYLPTLMGFELTLPALGLFIWGSLVTARRLLDGHQDPALATIPVIWLGLPFLAFIVLRTPIYGNIRQVLFALPPVFLLAAMGLEDIWRRLRHARAALMMGVLGVALLPAWAGIVTLHPYEYIYYNLLVGGVRRAEGRYELDHWCTSYREAMMYVDRTAPTGATVGVWGPLAAAADFARPDLSVVTDKGTEDVQFAIGCKRAMDQIPFHPDYETVYRVERDSAVLAVVKKQPAPR